MATIKGILRDELGNTISGCLLTFIEQKTLRRFQVITQSGDKHGSYCLVLPVGIFRVLLKPDRSFERDLGEITVYSDSPDGTLNSFLNAKNSDTRPEALRQFDALVQRAETAADTSGSGADSAAASAAVAGQYAEAAKTHAKQAAASEEAAGGYAQAAAGSASAAGSSAAQAAESHTGAQQALEEARQIAKDMVKPPPVFYRPAEERGIWQLSYEGTGRKVNWQFTGNRKNYGFYTYFSAPEPWEIRYPVSAPDDMVKYGCRARFTFSFQDDSDAALEGKDLMEVRLAIPDDALPPGWRVPPATPDRPYLVLGCVIRSAGGKLVVCAPDSSVTDTPLFKSGSARSSTHLFDMTLSRTGYSSIITVDSTGLSLSPVRTGVKLPSGTLYIRSASPAKQTNFEYLEMVIPHEMFNHRLVPDDDGATFYVPWGSTVPCRVTLPDTEFPPGFSVQVVTDRVQALQALTENDNVTFVSEKGAWASSVNQITGAGRLIHVGNKMWTTT
ncbi:prophage tail fiber N-terminal domain-containing protein [Salmonella enterica]|nr:prophage tail fiber N-terminal domain-containing protein [Salmonella enterica]ELH9140220.1 prophage tail fiber N-terminal domain-containing protein [Salmonella enterica]